MTLINFRLALCISVASIGGAALAACSSSSSGGGGNGGDGGTVYKPLDAGNQQQNEEGGTASPPVGASCTSNSQCTSPAECSNAIFKTGPLLPTPVCMSECVPSTNPAELQPCGLTSGPGSGICEPLGGSTTQGLCFALCELSAAGTTQGCQGSDACQILGAGPDVLGQTAATMAIGICEGGCTSSSQCPTGSSCDPFQGLCLTTVTAPADPVGASCNPSAIAASGTTPPCVCYGNSTLTTGVCTSDCVTGGPACPQPGSADGGAADAGTSLPFVCTAQLGGVNALDAGIGFATQPSGLLGICAPVCNQDSDCTGMLGTGATCSADPATPSPYQGTCLPPQ